MFYLIGILEQPFNLIYTFFILLSVGTWFLSFLGLSKNFSHNVELPIADTSLLHNWGSLFNFGALPLSISFTLLSFFVGLLGITGNEFILPLLSSDFQKTVSWIVIFFLSSLTSLKIVNLISKPLGLLFKDYGLALEAGSLIGKIAIVSSGKVTDSFGQANIEIEGDNIVLAVRTEDISNEIVYGETVLLTHFDKEKNIYWCEKY